MRTLLPKNQWHQRELAIYGTTCEDVLNLFNEISLSVNQRLVLVDASHEASEDISNHLNTQTNGFSLFQDVPLNSTTLANYSGVVVNGNHHTASAQIIVVNEKKKDSLLRRRDQLTNVLAIVYKEVDELPEYLQELKSNETKVYSEIEFLTSFIPSFFAVPNLNMLILAGGASKRMGQDKAMLKYNNEVQLDRIIQWSNQVELKPYLSVRESQLQWGDSFGVETIPDILKNAGPLGGIVSAMKFNPNSAWLVVACDLPLMNVKHLSSLIQMRNPKKLATCFKSPMDGGPEPLVTIYEPAAMYALTAWWANGFHCPRKMLFNSEIEIVEPNDNSVLMNVNTPEEKKIAESKL